MSQIKVTRRLRYVRFCTDLFTHFLTGNMFKDEIVNPLPPDTRFVRSGVDAGGNIILVIESKEFEEIDPNVDEIPPNDPILFRKGNTTNKEVH